MTTVEGAGLAIAEWPSTVRHLLRLRPSSRLILGQFVSLLVETFSRRAQLPVRPVFGSLFWASSAKQKALTNLVKDSVKGVVMSDDFSDISDEEVVSATQ